MNIVQELEDVLAEEQKHLLSGDFAALEELVDRKAELTEKLAKKKPDLPKDVYERLADHAAHNEALLGSARRGLQAAMALLRQMSDGETQQTYSREGTRRPLSRSPASVTQKL